MSKLGRQRRTPAQRIEAKVARQIMIREARDARAKRIIERLKATSDETLAEITALADEKK